jgi:short-subunit dehydrogenase
MSSGFASNYGPWALIAGASEGTGLEFARLVAAQGVNLILIARREGPLADAAKALRDQYGVECVTAAIDLAAPDSFAKIKASAGDREVGLFISNAGADPNGSRFLDKPLETWLQLVRRNVVSAVECCHHFGAKMRERGRGGILLVNSGAAYGGGSYLATYSATKAFELCLAEGLWAELKPHGVDVLTLIMGATDTPELRRLLGEKGLPVPTGTASAADVARQGLDQLKSGPVQNWGQAEDEQGFAPFSAAARRARVVGMDQASRAFFGEA